MSKTTAKRVAAHTRATKKGKTVTSEDFQGMRPAVHWFANEMERQLQENDHKSGWDTLSLKWLLNRLRQETQELERAIAKGTGITDEAADVANFAMMIADNSAVDAAHARAA